ncbi:hypothetical protein Tco_0340331 [Tanacetum coccineum]
MTPENKEHFLSENEAIFLLLTGIGDDIYSTVDACKIANEMWIAIERDNRVNLKYRISNVSSSSTDKCISTRHKGKVIAKPVTLNLCPVSEEDSDPEQAQRDLDLPKEFGKPCKSISK